MRVDDVIPILESAFQVGFMEAVKSYEPSRDSIRKKDLDGWLKMMRIDKKKFKSLVNIGQIKPFQIGSGRNSPLYYSKKEIRKALMAADVSQLLTSQEM